ncbi:thioredoxin family protein [Leifsonia shinshuensis]|uniref:TlpA family protein disulfide reductase n=1 Tax=Leifsonia shinshuensis TaxID=150026 RepID=UPI001F510A71|nr:thioredoxin family protein [Leifsonia shinshuensis]MCI0155961.1 thioredoxin family protein [Leifsonia shinshuensis]
MTAAAALLTVLALVALATVLGLVWKARAGRLRASRGDVRLTAAEVGAAELGSRATLVQFSTEFCAQCPATARVLGAIAADRDGVEHLDVDLTVRPELAGRFAVLQTPTTLLIDATGRVQGRISGPVRPAEVRSALDRILTE